MAKNENSEVDLSESRVSRELYLDAFRWMLLARTFEDKMSALYRAGKVVGGVYVGKGQEAYSVALGMQLDRSRGDCYGASIRDQAGRSAFGEKLLDGAQTCLGSVKGPMRGRDGNIHRGRPKEGMPAMISHLGSSVSVVNGMLLGKRFQGEKGMVGGVSAGDGSTSTGAFHEGVNQAAIEKLPLVIAVANNQFAYSTPTDRQFACENLVDRAIGYGIGGHICDGTELEDCLSVFKKAIELARSGEGPQMVVGKLLRLSGHGEHDDASYVPDSLKDEHFGSDCIKVARHRVLAENWMDSQSLEDFEQEIHKEVDETVVRAQHENPPSPVGEKWQAIATASLIEEQAENSNFCK